MSACLSSFPGSKGARALVETEKLGEHVAGWSPASLCCPHEISAPLFMATSRGRGTGAFRAHFPHFKVMVVVPPEIAVRTK